MPMDMGTCLRRLCIAALALAAWPAAAQARVVAVAGGSGATFVDVSSRKPVGNVTVGGGGTGVATSPDGSRIYVAGTQLAAIDPTTRATLGSAPLPAAATLAVSTDGARVYAAHKGGITVVDTMAPVPVLGPLINLPGSPQAIAVSSDGTRAVVTQTKGRAVIVDLVGFRVIKRLEVARPAGVAFAPRSSRAWVVSAGTLKKQARLVAVDTVGLRLAGAITLGRGLGGGIAFSPDGNHAIVGADANQDHAAVVSFRGHGSVVSRPRTGKGFGYPAWSQDGSRIYMADRFSGTLSVLSGFRYGRLSTVRLGFPGRGVAVQPGLATLNGTDGPDRLTGTRGPDRIEGFAGDDVLFGGRDNDVLLGDLGNDQLTGGPADDRARRRRRRRPPLRPGGQRPAARRAGQRRDVRRHRQRQGRRRRRQRLHRPGRRRRHARWAAPATTRSSSRRWATTSCSTAAPGNDLIKGGRGSDTIKGGDGDDQLFGESGGENIDAGNGNDTVDGGRAGDRIYGRDGNDTLRGDAGRDSIYGGSGDDEIDGGSDDDYLSGSYGADTIIGGPGATTINAGTGNDVIRVADDYRRQGRLRAGQGHRLRREHGTRPRQPHELRDRHPDRSRAGHGGGAAVDHQRHRRQRHLFGTEGDDSLFGDGGNDVLFGNGGNDYVDGEDGDDELHGGPGDDQIYGRNDNDVILGNEGNDYLEGDRGDDTINGGPGNDRIYGNLGIDTIAGDEGDDRINVVDGLADKVSCGDGNDVVFADPADIVASDCESVRR